MGWPEEIDDGVRARAALDRLLEVADLGLRDPR
jgi:hypothetical protein